METMTLPATLKMIKTSHEKHPYRTEEIEGNLLYPPIVGASLILHSTGLTEGKPLREVTTSPVISITWDDVGCHFETTNSVYDLRIHVEAEQLKEIRSMFESNEEPVEFREVS